MSTLIVDFPRPSHRPLPSTADAHQEARPRRVSVTDGPVPKRRRLVRFSPTSTLHAYHVQDPTTTSSWYSPDDEARFKLQAKQEILAFRLLKSQGRYPASFAEDGATPHGLERQLISADYTRQRALSRGLVALAVRTAQALPASPSESEENKWERIADAARRRSAWARDQARTMGTLQARGARA